MAYIGKVPTAAPLTSSDITDGIISTAKMADTAITNAKLNADIISADTALGAAPADTDELLVSDAGVLKRMDYSYIKAANTPAFFAVRGSSQAIASGSDIKIAVDTEQLDTDSAYDPSTNYRFTVPSGEGGKYLVCFQIRRSAWGSNILRAMVKVNGSGTNLVSAEDESSGINDYASAGNSLILSLDAADYIELYGHQNTGSDQNIYGSTTDRATYFGAFKLIGV